MWHETDMPMRSPHVRYQGDQPTSL